MSHESVPIVASNISAHAHCVHVSRSSRHRARRCASARQAERPHSADTRADLHPDAPGVETSMPPRSAQRANGSLSARQWADLHQAARLARSENVTIQWRGTNNITILPGPPRGDRPGEKEQAMRTAPPRNEGSRRPPEPEAPRNNSKKQQRDADRRHYHVPKRVVWHLGCTSPRLPSAAHAGKNARLCGLCGCGLG